MAVNTPVWAQAWRDAQTQSHWIDPALLLAIARHESGEGMVSQGRFTLGISQGFSSGGGSPITTPVDGRFNQYTSLQQAGEDLRSFLTQNPRYANAASLGHSPAQFLNQLGRSGYASTPGHSEYNPRWPATILGIRQRVAQTFGGSTPNPPGSGGLVSPIAGLRSDQLRAHWDNSNAIDIFAPLGTAIRAIRSGVATAQVFPLGGNTVTVVGDDGVTDYYAHLQHPGVSGRVTSGQVIGAVGETGNAAGTGAHLHLGMSTSGINSAGAGNVNVPDVLRKILAAGGNLINDITGGSIPPGGSAGNIPGGNANGPGGFPQVLAQGFAKIAGAFADVTVGNVTRGTVATGIVLIAGLVLLVLALFTLRGTLMNVAIKTSGVGNAVKAAVPA